MGSEVSLTRNPESSTIPSGRFQVLDLGAVLFKFIQLNRLLRRLFAPSFAGLCRKII